MKKVMGSTIGVSVLERKLLLHHELFGPSSLGTPSRSYLCYSNGTEMTLPQILLARRLRRWICRILTARRKSSTPDSQDLHPKHSDRRRWSAVNFLDVVASQNVPLASHASSPHEPASYLSSASTHGQRSLVDLACLPWRTRSLPVIQQDHRLQYSLSSEPAASSQL